MNSLAHCLSVAAFTKDTTLTITFNAIYCCQRRGNELNVISMPLNNYVTCASEVAKIFVKASGIFCLNL